jgi:hypothetical protein
MPYDERVIERYKGVCALSEQGSAGERQNAQDIRTKMEAKYPGIHAEAFPPQASPPPGFDPFRNWRTKQPETGSAPEPEAQGSGWSGFWGGSASGAQGASGAAGAGGDPRGRRWQETAQDVLGWAARVAQEMSSLGTARAYAESITELQTKMLQSGKWQIAVKFPLRDLYAVAGNMNEAQRQEFARHVAAMVQAEVLAALEEGA